MSDIKRLVLLFRPYWGWLALGILLSLATLAANMVLMAMSGWFIAAMALAGLAGTGINYFTPAAIIRAMAISRTVGRYLERLVTHEATLRLIARLRGWFYRHLEPLAPARLQRLRSGDLLSRIGADIDLLENFYLRFIVPVAVFALALPLTALVLTRYSGTVALAVTAALIAAGIALPLLAGRFSAEPARRQVQHLTELRGNFVEQKQGLGELIVFGALERRQLQLEAFGDSLVGEQRRLRRIDALMQAASGVVANLAVFAVMLIAVPLVGAGSLDGPELPMLMLLVLAAFEMVTAMPPALQSLALVRAAARRLFEIVDSEPAVGEPASPRTLLARPTIEASGLTFAYDAATGPVLRDISLQLPPGKKLALVGATGSGKSSIANLLLRFWPAPQGSLSLDGHDIAAYDADSLRGLFAVLPQRIHLFNTTIRANLLLANPDATPEEIEAACRAACLHDFIAGLPEGYDTFVGEAGTLLSGGEARRLGIARALLKDAPILLLDEPGEALDPGLQRQVMANILAAGDDRSLILITHALTGLAAMDEILVIDRGRIIERGTHAELLAQGGAYRRLHDLLGDFGEVG